MLRKLERDFVAADLAAVEGLLSNYGEDVDPIGFLQFTERKKRLQRQLQDLDNLIKDQLEIGVFFDGPPVDHRYGISAEFCGEAIALLSALMAPHGRLFVTVLGRRTIGLLLRVGEEGVQSAAYMLPIDALDRVARNPHTIECLDQSILDLLNLLKKQRASMRIVCGAHDFTLDYRMAASTS
ncbi:hypothetical protein GJ697_26140 [Pseudoduganella sp. FT25W]|jgi:hypothetical protein|uniref:Uncharacterized protein n=1 Tax=Duganella alba TaxID=2666081 RepID=A0A6L5QR38_9BURK|nr:hypothetical protein [Duganella alba]MRX11311.1 hypothetical protein [Duganella alba]MRX19386.1 hypothetical protein [Duganella alba]